jgi:hypothetical protein
MASLKDGLSCIYKDSLYSFLSVGLGVELELETVLFPHSWHLERVGTAPLQIKSKSKEKNRKQGKLVRLSFRAGPLVLQYVQHWGTIIFTT